jgi:hypothetical protein
MEGVCVCVCVCVFNRIEQLRKFKLLNLPKKSDVIVEIVVLICFLCFKCKVTTFFNTNTPLSIRTPPHFWGYFSFDAVAMVYL